METYDDVREIVMANRRLGQHFFDKDTMSFFRSKVAARVYGGRFFITSESIDGEERRFTVRECVNGDINTVAIAPVTEGFYAYKSHYDAKQALLKHLKTTVRQLSVAEVI